MSKANKGQAGDKGEIVEPNPSKTRKIDQVIALLRRPEGATAAQISEATGWQAHSVRGAIAGQLRNGMPPRIRNRRLHDRILWRGERAGFPCHQSRD